MKTTLTSQIPTTNTQKAPDTRAIRDRATLKKACQDFEAIFIQSMFKSMRKTVPEGGLFKGDHATEMYQDMIDQDIATQISRRQSLGLADQMYRQMEKLLPDSE